ncbi:MAG: RecX family transcriptional regulator [Alphaproteobacteria bacterium]|nr:RecX family transcriptional regulator [Alphaproteobacteria bacterium]MBV9370387.1 RecX family transcriptional regulator [Alphaproteobacteria bacterium]MBV9901956.1 RecX family transcriptional regulator [Alphaproteobacteria bacterium]
MNSQRTRRPRPPLDEEGLERLALAYAGRYGTTRAKLAAYLERKLRERGWAGGGEAPVEPIVQRFSALGYVDDRAFAAARAGALLRRGYGERRVDEALRAAGIEAPDGEAARREARDDALAAALRYAARRGLGPYAPEPMERPARDKAAAAMLRAGHRGEIVRRIVNALPGEVPDPDSF